MTDDWALKRLKRVPIANDENSARANLVLLDATHRSTEAFASLWLGEGDVWACIEFGVGFVDQLAKLPISRMWTYTGDYKIESGPCEQCHQQEWTGPITRSRARLQVCGASNSAGFVVAGPSNQVFNRELSALQQHNELLKREKPGGFSMGAAPTNCIDSISISSDDSHFSARSCPQGQGSPVSAAIAESSSPRPSPRGDSSRQPTHSFPSPQRMNLLETLVRAFPLTVPEEEIGVFFESCAYYPDLTPDLKRHFLERRRQRRNELENKVSVFSSESPWEPKWFTNPLTKLILSTKARPTIYKYIFDAKLREEESMYLTKWKALSGFVRYTVGVGATFAFIIAICFLIDTFGEEGVNFSVPLIFFVNVIINKILINMSGALPSDI